MRLSPDEIVLWQVGFIKLNATIAFTWVLMFLLVIGSLLVTRHLYKGGKRSRWQNLLEIIVTSIEQQLKEVGLQSPRAYIGFLGTLFLFIASATLSSLIPGFEPPTSSLSTTVALAICVFIAVPLYGITQRGFIGYLKSYMEPSFIMLPFNLIGEVSRTIALAVRLFGNMMSDTLIIAMLLALTPLLFPIVMSLLGLLTGMVQAYIFFILAAVYITAATGSNKSET